jgi:hypothetical protein
LVLAFAITGCEEETPVAAPTADKAVLTMELVDFTYTFKDGRHTYGHTRRYVESAGLGVVLHKGKACVHNGEECAGAVVKYRIEPSATLEQKGHYVATKQATDTITVEYWGKDDKGADVTLRRVIRVKDKTATVE